MSPTFSAAPILDLVASTKASFPILIQIGISFALTLSLANAWKGHFILEITQLSQCKRQAAGLMREQLSNKCRPDKRAKAPYM